MRVLFASVSAIWRPHRASSAQSLRTHVSVVGSRERENTARLFERPPRFLEDFIDAGSDLFVGIHRRSSSALVRRLPIEAGCSGKLLSP
jgi:hypothetical protein